MFSEDLENQFKPFGDIISCKVSLNDDNTSRGYGYVCFKEPESAARALAETSSRTEFIGVKFASFKAEFQRVEENIFVK